MFRRLLFIVLFIFSWLVFFELARVFFLFYEWPYSSNTPFKLNLLSLWYGLKMDISMASYMALPVCLFVLLGLFVPFFNKRIIYVIYTAILLFIQIILVVVDAELYKAWGHRVDITPLKYFSHPREMWASISYLPLPLIIPGLLILYLLFLWVFRKILRSTATRYMQNNKMKWAQSLIILTFMVFLVLPIRGGFQLAPLNQSAVYFSNNQFANNAALNASWNFMYAIEQVNMVDKNPYEYMDVKKANEIVNNLFSSDNKIEQIINASDSIHPNVILITWESFTEKALHVIVDGKPVTPYFEELKKEGIYFDRCYSSGDRTDKGISAILSGYPALPKGSVINFPEKASVLPGLGKMLSGKKYSTEFYYGGEAEFANIKGYLISQNFQHFVTKEHFKKSDLNSKWGAHDHIVKDRILQDIPSFQQPYFLNWLTLSSHEPFEIPVPSAFKGKDITTRFLNSLHYTDSCVYEFINELKKRPEWNNTLVIISADHGHYEPVTGKRADNYHIPVLFLGGALKKSNLVITKTVSQLDIATTVAQQFGMPSLQFLFGKNLFDSSAKHWAFFTFNDGVGLVTDSSRILFDNAGKKIVFEEGKTVKEDQQIAEALMQVLYTDFLKR